MKSKYHIFFAFTFLWSFLNSWLDTKDYEKYKKTEIRFGVQIRDNDNRVNLNSPRGLLLFAP